MRKVTCILIAAAAFAAMSSGARAELHLSNTFNDHMVLQQGKPVNVWGRAKPGAEITVTLSELRPDAIKAVGADALKREAPETKAPKSGDKPEPIVRIEYVHDNAPAFETVTRKAKTDADGRWRVQLGATAASFKPKFLCVSGDGGKIAILDVLVGEVWVTAGQSNMAYAGDKTGWLNKQGLLLPGVRYAHTGKNSSYKPLDDVVERAEWIPANGKDAARFSTVPYLFGKYLHSKLRVPVGIINASSGGAHGNFWCSIEHMRKIDFWTVKKMLAERDKAVAIWENPAARKKLIDAYEADYRAKHAEWKTAAAKAKADRKRAPSEPKHRPPGAPKDPHKISCLFNGRIAPIGKLSIRGALYLQGEQQVLTWCISRYRHIFPRIITSFRDAFGDPKLPFGVITLQGGGHNKMPITELGACNRTAAVREIHYKAHLAAPNTGFIPAHDVGRGLHPSWKRPLAERAVHWALRSVYKTIPDNSISVDKIEYADGKARLHLVKQGQRRKRIKGGYKTEIVKSPFNLATWSGNDSQYLGGFLIAGADKRWYPAKAEPKGKGKGLEIWSDLVDNPIALRYGWGSYPIANIGAWENPLPPFRTDDWPVIESVNIDPDLRAKARSDWYVELHASYANMLDRIIRRAPSTPLAARCCSMATPARSSIARPIGSRRFSTRSAPSSTPTTSWEPWTTATGRSAAAMKRWPERQDQFPPRSQRRRPTNF